MTKKALYLIGGLALTCLVLGVILFRGNNARFYSSEPQIKITVFNPPLIVTSSGIIPSEKNYGAFEGPLAQEVAFLAAPNWSIASNLFTPSSKPFIERTRMDSNFDMMRQKHPPESLTKTIFAAVEITNQTSKTVLLQTAPYRVPPNAEARNIAVDCFRLVDGKWKFDKNLESSKLWYALTYTAASQLEVKRNELKTLASQMVEKKSEKL